MLYNLPAFMEPRSVQSIFMRKLASVREYHESYGESRNGLSVEGNWFEGDERVIKELIRKLIEERTFQVGFERALQAFGISKEDYEKL